MCREHHLSIFIFLLSLVVVDVQLLLLSEAAAAGGNEFSECSEREYYCGGQRYDLSYPFRVPSSPEYCGHPGFEVICNDANTTLQIKSNQKNFIVNSIDPYNGIMQVMDPSFYNVSCPWEFANYTFDPSLNYSSQDVNLTVFANCSTTTMKKYGNYLRNITCLATSEEAGGYNSFYSLPSNKWVPPLEVRDKCHSVAAIPVYKEMEALLNSSSVSFPVVLKAGFALTWEVANWYTACTASGGACGFRKGATNAETCFCSHATSVGGRCTGPTIFDATDAKSGKAIAIGASLGAAALIAVCCAVLCWCKRRKRLQHLGLSKLLSLSNCLKLSSTEDPELGESNYHTHIFSYDELQEATNGFDVSRELGDGGFGTVYKGNLRDGRTVAVKRLYENNYRRLQQFMNEVDILSRLRHQNLVTLYGCTSRHSRELLLVYEYIPNGTVADHLHGMHGAASAAGHLPWHCRISIAIETADALAYLHAVEPQIIHRDVKSNNILLDNNFHVKVADFGLSRLFPLDATHVSTAPQGTPGYLDPEYHQCYQLTDKSDVYSFGVVLVELISSKPAVDISRTRHEINLANMAVTKIQKSELDQLVDPLLGYHSDLEVKRMITQVAELAFTCLQSDGDLRPSIKEVLEILRGIESGSYNKRRSHDEEEEEEEEEAAAAAAAQVQLETQSLKNVSPFSPDTVTERWQSRSTTPSNSKSSG